MFLFFFVFRVVFFFLRRSGDFNDDDHDDDDATVLEGELVRADTAVDASMESSATSFVAITVDTSMESSVTSFVAAGGGVSSALTSACRDDLDLPNFKRMVFTSVLVTWTSDLFQKVNSGK